MHTRFCHAMGSQAESHHSVETRPQELRDPIVNIPSHSLGLGSVAAKARTPVTEFEAAMAQHPENSKPPKLTGCAEAAWPSPYGSDRMV